MTKKTYLTIAAVSVLSVGLVAATSAYAQTTQNSVPSLVQEIAQKFNLNTSDVQSVFTQHRQEMQARQEANYENYLANLVNTGKITAEQEQLILTKHKQLISQIQSEIKNFKSMTPAERKTQRQATVKDLQNWAKQNNIKLQYLRPFGPRKFGRWVKPTVTPIP